MVPPSDPLPSGDIDLAMWSGEVPDDHPDWWKLAMLLGDESITLTEEDEAALDAIWDRIAAEERQHSDQGSLPAGMRIEHPAGES